MSLGLIGKKCGMTRIFTEDGVSIPVTVVEVINNKITQIKTDETDGYCAVQISAGNRLSNVTKPMVGHYAKAGVEPGDIIREFRVKDAAELADRKVGDEIKVDLFEEGQKIDAQGLSRGKGFAGTVKRHNFKTQDATHGNSLSHRAPGSIGQCQTPGRVLKGKKMAGHMGNVNRTVQSQKIVKIDIERNLILIKGAVPGAPDGKVIITRSVKSKGDK